MNTKCCTTCKTEKPLTEFSRHKDYRFGVRAQCKRCAVAYMGKYQKEKREEVNAYRVTRYSGMKEVERVRSAKKYRSAKPYYLAASGKRRAMQMLAVPKWTNDFFIEEAHALATLRTRISGFQWSVDHIVPIKSALVCGLHCEGNIQVIPHVENIRKGNRRWPDMPSLAGAIQ